MERPYLLAPLLAARFRASAYASSPSPRLSSLLPAARFQASAHAGSLSQGTARSRAGSHAGPLIDRAHQSYGRRHCCSVAHAHRKQPEDRAGLRIRNRPIQRVISPLGGVYRIRRVAVNNSLRQPPRISMLSRLFFLDFPPILIILEQWPLPVVALNHRPVPRRDPCPLDLYSAFASSQRSVCLLRLSHRPGKNLSL